MSEEPKIHTINGHQIELPEGRKVWVGERDDSFYIQFISKEGDIRRLRISHEAADALVKLLTAPQEIYRFILRLKDETKMTWEWVNAPPDAPSPQATATTPEGE